MHFSYPFTAQLSHAMEPPPPPASSAITDEDLSSLSFAPLAETDTGSSDGSRTLYDAPVVPPRRRVLFCPIALLYTCAADGETDPVLKESFAQESKGGRPRLAVRTYS